MQIQKNPLLISQVTPFQATTLGQQYIITKNLSALLNLVLANATEFQSTTVHKLKAIQQLKAICSLADVSEHLTLIFKALAKSYTADENFYQKEVANVCFVIGLRISPDYYLPTLLNLAQYELQSQQTRTLASFLHLITTTIQHEQDTLDLPPLVRFVSEVDANFADCFEVVDALFLLVSRIIQVTNNNLPLYTRPLFQVLLTVKSYALHLNQAYQQQVNGSFEALAQKCGYSVADLHGNEVNLLLEHVGQSEQYKAWRHNSRDFLKFKAILQGCGEGVTRFMGPIIQIMRHSLQLDQDVELRLEVLLLLDQMLKMKQIQTQLYANSILHHLLIPSMIWKVGKPNVKTRKAAVIIAHQVLDYLSTKEINEAFPALSAPLKSCLTDDWAPDVRFASIKLTSKLLGHQLDFELLREFYPALLERMDDSQNQIRIETCAAISKALEQQSLCKSSIVEYIVKAVLIHLDDSSEEVQKAVFLCLQQCPEKELLLRECESQVKNFKYPRLCQELIKYSKERI